MFLDGVFKEAWAMYMSSLDEQKDAIQAMCDIFNRQQTPMKLTALWYCARERAFDDTIEMATVSEKEQALAESAITDMEAARKKREEAQRKEEQRKSNARFVRTDDSLKKARSEASASDLLRRLRLQFDFECENDGVDEEAWEQDWLDCVRRNPYEGRRHCVALGAKAGGWFIWEDETAECAGGVLFVTDEEYEKLEGRA